MVASRGRRSSLEQERSRRSRDALIEAAAELLADDDLASVKIEDICRTAGVSKGLFYFYFGSKEELVVELLTDDARAVAAEIDVGWQFQLHGCDRRRIVRRPALCAESAHTLEVRNVRGGHGARARMVGAEARDRDLDESQGVARGWLRRTIRAHR